MSKRQWAVTPTASGRTHVVHPAGRAPTINDEAFLTAEEAHAHKDKLEAGWRPGKVDGITVLEDLFDG